MDDQDTDTRAIAEVFVQVVIASLQCALAHHNAHDGNEVGLKRALKCPKCMDLIGAIRSLGLRLSQTDPLRALADACDKVMGEGMK